MCLYMSEVDPYCTVPNTYKERRERKAAICVQGDEDPWSRLTEVGLIL